MARPFGVENLGVVDADEVACAGLVVATAIETHVAADHGDPLGGFGEFSAAVHHHVAVKRHGVTRSSEVGGHDALARRCFATGRYFGDFVFCAVEPLELATREFGGVAHHHHVVQSDGVVVPLVDRLVRFGCGFVVDVTDMHRHRVRCHRGAENTTHQFGEVRTEAQVSQPTRPVAAAPYRVFDAVAGASLVDPQLARHVEQHFRAFFRQDPERRGRCHRCGRGRDVVVAVAEFFQCGDRRRGFELKMHTRIEDRFSRDPAVAQR